MDAVIIIVALVAGTLIGWLLCARRAEAEVRAAVTDAAALRATLQNEYAAAERREALLLRADAESREALGAEAAEALERVQLQLVELQRGRVSSDAVLREQARAMTDASRLLHTEASQLVTALRAPQIRGRWGEMQLERVVEAAGMTEHIDYDTQVTTTADGSTQRPDLVVRLAGGKQIVVDSKVAFSAYLEAAQAGDEPTRDARLKAHAKQLRQHVDQLAAKSYWQRFTPTPEFVVCFVPADAVLDAALREDPALLEHAFSSNVVLATPSTLVALLRTVAYTWRQEALAANAEAVHELGRELYRRISTMGGHVDRLGRSLSGAVSAYNDAVGSLERRVVSTARRMSELGVVSADAELIAPEPLLDAVTRPLTVAELVEPRLVALRGAERDGA
ncbi:MAG TPA: DNA recombination protein RmuC [Jatrophihabitantaceae bacterium]|jgi:DNA recombination protein RmuC|nr:DNA recombination protein RmuC [Jatrophihabitantaceae bacterium]